jgi:riboflavin kinase/FMN adenylyltransferase
MQVFRNPAEFPHDYGNTVVTIGNFDGVHLGHRFLLRRVVERARALGSRAVAVTFDPHPTQFLRPDAAPLLITPSLDERLSLLATTGVDATLVLPFTSDLSQQSAAAFAADVLVGQLHVVEVHEGSNFRFGYRAEAGVAELHELGRELGFGVNVYEPLHVRGIDVSSSRIRKLVATGDVRRARWLLGRPISILSTPAPGRGIGTRLVVPTINLASYGGLVPATGVYVTRMQVGGVAGAEPGLNSANPMCFDAVTNVGTRPTFADAAFAIETHLLDYDPRSGSIELTGTTPLRLTFLARLRDERAWPSPEALREQIGRDVRRARRYLSHLQPA